MGKIIKVKSFCLSFFYEYTAILITFPNLHSNPLRMRRKFRGIHALDGRNAIGKIAVVGNTQGVFKYIRAFWQPIKKEIGGSIASAFVVAQAALVFMLGKHVQRFKSGGAHIFHVYVFQAAIYPQFNAHFDEIAGTQRSVLRDFG